MSVFDPVLRLANNFSSRDALFVDVSLALFTHLIFNRFEPFTPVIVFPLLFGVPIIPSLLLSAYFSTSAAFVIALGVYWTAILSSIAFYRLSPIHPLSRYPGPTHLKLSTLWVYKMGMTGQRHLYIQKLHEQYDSDIVRVGPNELSFREISSIAQIMGTQGLPRGPSYDGLVAHKKIRPLVAWRDASVHAKRRLPWNRGLNTSALKEYDSALAERVTQLVDLLLSENGKAVNVADKLKFFSYDFMGDMAFGGVSELMRNGDIHGQLQRLRTSIASNIIRSAIPWSTYYFPNPGKGFVSSAISMATERISKGNSRRDLFYYLNNEDGHDSVSTPLYDVVAEASLVIAAGSDTTSLALSNILYLLMRYPQAYKRLQEEVDKFYPHGENALDSAFHPEMMFLEAVINEALRLYPVVPSGVQRFVEREGAMISSSYIPPGTSVRVHTWSVQRDPRNFFPSPNEFWPERWLIAEKPSLHADVTPFIHNPNAFIPFSFGPANCVGKSLALKEMRTVLCHLLQQVDIRFAKGFDPTQWDDHLEDCLTLEVGKLPVVITPRNGSV